MKTTAKLLTVFVIFFSSNIVTAQYSHLTVTVNWPANSNENKIEVYDTANNMLLSMCDQAQCYTSTQSSTEKFAATYDFGCASNGTNYYVKLYNINDNGWKDSAYVVVKVDGVEVLNNDGSTANISGQSFYFDVTSDGAYCNSLPDKDNDNVKDYLDQDDDNDGVLDIHEGIGINTFDCQIPELNFFGGYYDSTASSNTEGNVGAVYRFENAIVGYDILMEIIALDNTSIQNIDVDTVDNPNFLQTELTFSGTGTPGATFRFTIVDAGQSTPTTDIFRIGGTSWDIDGNKTSIRESIVYYNPSAYGIDNPSTLFVEDLGSDTYQISASGELEGSGFSTLKTLRAYFQYKGNSFTLRMQTIKSSSGDSTRQFPMSFSQCNLLDFTATALTIVYGEDNDNDGLDNQYDIDSDNDGIPDNVEAQSTTGYIAPSGTINTITGIDIAYGNGIDIIDTDGDIIADMFDTNSDNDNLLDIQENGMPNNLQVFVDLDNDGLDDLFEGLNLLDPLDVNDEIDIPSLSILPDTDGDLAFGGDLDYRDGIDVFFDSATIDFDGIDDYMDSNFDFSGLSQVTAMAWVKIDNAFSNTGTVLNQGNFKIEILGNGKVSVIANQGSISSSINDALKLNQWTHIAVVFDSSLTDNNLKLYINGTLIAVSSHNSLTSSLQSGTDLFTIGKNADSNGQYFKGSIDEVRIFNSALTEEQLHQGIHQEIENRSGLVTGKIIPKNIKDFNSNSNVSWSKLMAYYPMTNILSSKTIDFSTFGHDAVLHNITSIQEQTAPMPYQTSADGLWSNESTWLHGGVWDILDKPDTTNPWSIIKVSNNITASTNIKSSGLIIDDQKTLIVNGDYEINNSWYFELNGTLDLKDDAQLVQTNTSDLVTDADGEILRRQEGNSNYFWYNYWTSPVGSTTVTTLTDNNTSANNENNTPFRLNMLKDGNGDAIQFTNAYHQTGKISTYWLYTYQNGLTYWNWSHISPSTNIQPGIGYTQKGTGNTEPEQQYIFEGKPNNGTILIAANDVDGDTANESIQNSTYTSTLIGNPYPSAIDARKFINDNAGIIGGTILLWEQWAGNSHNLAEYQGGYGYINALTTERAYQHADIPIADQMQTQGIKTPTAFIPVGQSFFVEVINDGHIEFNNGQRVFKKENEAESTFFRTQNVNANTNSNYESSPYQLIRLEFATSEGSTRRFVVGFGNDATDGLDYGLDGGFIPEGPEDDMGSLLNNNQFVIQTFAPITPNKEVDLILKSSGNFSYSIKSVEIQNIDDNQDIFLRDNLTGYYHDLRSDTSYNFTSTAGTFNDRFDIVFQTGNTLSNDDFDANTSIIYVNNQTDLLYVKELKEQVKQLTLTNMLGQTVRTITNTNNQQLENGINIGNLSTGVYIVVVKTNYNRNISKKIIIN